MIFKTEIQVGLILFGLIISCSPLRYIDNNKKLRQIPITDNELLQTIELYKKSKNNFSKGFPKALIEISTQDIHNPETVKYITHTYSLYGIFNYPISAYTVYNNDTILIYSKKDRYMNPRNYPKNFVDNLQHTSMDDWHLPEIEYDGVYYYQIKNVRTNHSIPWKYKKGEIDSLSTTFLKRLKFLYGDKSFSYMDYDNLDSLRIVPYSHKK